jgi:hypothetical protein
MVEAPKVFTRWMTSWRMKTVSSIEGMVGRGHSLPGVDS